MRMQPSKDEMHEMKHSTNLAVQRLANQLSPMGRFRAANLWQVFGTGNTPEGKYSTPDVIYAMKAGDVRASHLVQCIGHASNALTIVNNKYGQFVRSQAFEQCGYCQPHQQLPKENPFTTQLAGVDQMLALRMSIAEPPTPQLISYEPATRRPAPG